VLAAHIGTLDIGGVNTERSVSCYQLFMEGCTFPVKASFEIRARRFSEV